MRVVWSGGVFLCSRKKKEREIFMRMRICKIGLLTTTIFFRTAAAFTLFVQTVTHFPFSSLLIIVHDDDDQQYCWRPNSSMNSRARNRDQDNNVSCCQHCRSCLVLKYPNWTCVSCVLGLRWKQIRYLFGKLWPTAASYYRPCSWIVVGFVWDLCPTNMRIWQTRRPVQGRISIFHVIIIITVSRFA